MLINPIHWLRPEALWLLSLVPVIGILFWRQQRGSGSWSKVIDPILLPHILTAGATQSKRWRWIGPVALFCLAIFSIAGPSISKINVPVFQRADALVIVLDLSASMAAADTQPSRVQRAQQKIRDVLATRTEGVTGLVAFAGDAHVVTPLTDDTATIANLLPALTPDIMPIPGADASAALVMASDLLTAAGLTNGHILLITDGLPKFRSNLVRDALSSAGARLSILGVGTATGAPIPLADGGFLRDNKGEIVVPRLNTVQLQAIANELNGQYVGITLDDNDVNRVTQLDIFDARGEVSIERKTDTWRDEGHWLALLVGIGMLPLFRRGALAVLLLGLLPLLNPMQIQAQTQTQTQTQESTSADVWRNLWLTPDQQGAQRLEQGDPTAAALYFETPQWRGTAFMEAGDYPEAVASFSEVSSADGLYNLGNAKALTGDLPGALSAYDQSLALAPDREDALRNRALIESLLEQQQQQQSDSDENGERDNEDTQSDNDNETESNGGQQDPQQNQQDQQSQSDSEGNNDPSQGSPDDAPPENGSSSQSSDNPQQSAEDQQAMREELSEALENATDAQMSKFDQALEKQQALEQWLRRVPDDPGGLMRRKFRYESLQKLRSGDEPDEDVRW